MNAGFKFRKFDIIVDPNQSMEKKINFGTGAPWQPARDGGPQIAGTSYYRYSFLAGYVRYFLPGKSDYLYLPFHSESEMQFSSSSIVIAHELGHLTETAHLQPPADHRITPFYKMTLSPWQEARACLIDYFLTGNDTVLGSEGSLSYSIGLPTTAHIREVGPSVEAHILGQIIGHIILQSARLRDKAWLAKLIHLMDRKISPADFSIRNRYKVDHMMNTVAMDIPEEFLNRPSSQSRESRIEMYQQHIHSSYKGMDFTFEKFLEAALELNVPPSEIIRIRQLMKTFGFASIRQ